MDLTIKLKGISQLRDIVDVAKIISKAYNRLEVDGKYNASGIGDNAYEISVSKCGNIITAFKK